MNGILEEVQAVFRDVFDEETLEINMETTHDDIEDWDSMEQINIIAVLEKKYGIKFDLADVMGIESVGDMVAVIEEKTK